MKVEQEDLDMLADLECPECGPLVEDGAPTWLSWEVNQEGVDKAINDRICPVCGEELSETLEASIANLKMVVERRPDLADAVSQRLADALSGEDE